MRCVMNNEPYCLNLIDTPGHVDFSYEVYSNLFILFSGRSFPDSRQQGWLLPIRIASWRFSSSEILRPFRVYMVNFIVPFSTLKVDLNIFETIWLDARFPALLLPVRAHFLLLMLLRCNIYFLPVSFNSYLSEDICLLHANAQNLATDFTGFQYTFAAMWKMYDGLMQGVEAQTLANVYLALENNLEIIPVCSTPFPVHKLWFLFSSFTIIFISLPIPIHWTSSEYLKY